MVTRKLTGLAYHVEYLCYRRGIKCREAFPATIKKFITGRGDAKKKQVIEAVRQQGFPAVTHDEADAIALYLYTLKQMFPEAYNEVGAPVP